jgi:hypothetical protein
MWSVRSLVLAAVLLAALLPETALAQARKRDGGFDLRTNGDYTLAAGERVASAVVIRGDARIEGTVTDALVVINGDATVASGGRVDDTVVVVRGNLRLEAGSRVDDVMLVRSDLDRDPGATVTGSIRHSTGPRFGWAAGVFWVGLWIGLTVAVLLAALIFAAVAGRQLARAAMLLTADAPYAILSAVVLWIALPLVAVVAFVTVIGIPFGFGLLLLVLPELWFLGYIAAGTRLGLQITGPEKSGDHPYLAAFLGVLILQLIGFVPVIGILIDIIAGLYGSGALVLMAFRNVSGPGATPAPAPA